jgi:MFS family permease
LTKSYGWELVDLWKIYLPAMIAGVLAMGPAAVMAEKKGKFKEVLLIGIIFFALSFSFIGYASTQILFLIGIIIFFIGFNMHEPIMQSLTTRYIKVHEKGKVLGVFNSFGYLGTFVGGFVGGIYLKEIDGSFIQSLHDISIVVVAISILWLLLILTLPNPLKKKNIYINIDECDESKYTALDKLTGIDEWYLNNTEKLLVVKYDQEIINEETIKRTVN